MGDQSWLHDYYYLPSWMMMTMVDVSLVDDCKLNVSFRFGAWDADRAQTLADNL